jgi:hypothetical protein
MDTYLPIAIINVTTQDELWGQFIDIENQSIKYVNPENDLTFMYVITSLSLCQIFTLYLLYQYVH